jgi:hypothetical protein
MNSKHIDINRIQVVLPNGATCSIVQIDHRLEVAVLQNDEFVSITEWTGATFDDDVAHIARTSDDLALHIVMASRWALNNMEVK